MSAPPPVPAVPPPSPPGPSPAPRARRPRSRLVWLWLLAIPAVPLLLVGAMAALGLVYVWTAKKVPVTGRDREMVLDIRALAARMEDFSPAPVRESIRKERYFDGSWEVEYEYDDPADSAPYLTCTVGWEPKVSDAAAGYLIMWHGATLGLRYGSDATLTVAERNDLFRWGDQSRLGILMLDGKPVGNVFVARKGKTMFSVLFSGVYFDEPDELAEMLEPVLGKILLQK